MFLYVFSKVSGLTPSQRGFRSLSTGLHIWFHSLNSLSPHTIKSNPAADISEQRRASPSHSQSYCSTKLDQDLTKYFMSFSPASWVRTHCSTQQQPLQGRQHSRSERRARIHRQLQQGADSRAITP